MSDNMLVSFLKEIGLRVVLEKDKVTVAIGGKQPQLPQPQQPQSDDSDITGDDNYGR